MGQAEQFFVALKRLGKDVMFVRFRDETHEVSRTGKPRHRLARFRFILVRQAPGRRVARLARLARAPSSGGAVAVWRCGVLSSRRLTLFGWPSCEKRRIPNDTATMVLAGPPP